MNDEPFTESRSQQLIKEMVRQFEVKRKKAFLLFTLYMIICLVIFFQGGCLLMSLDTMKGMLASAILMLIGFESTVLIKLWYSTVDSRITLMKEFKQLQLFIQGQRASDEEELSYPVEGGGDVGSSFWERISLKTMRRVCTVVILVVGIVGAHVFIVPLFKPAVEPLSRSEYHANVGNDGSVRVTARITQTYHGVTPLAAVTVCTGDELHDVVWREKRGGVLSHEAKRGKKDCCYRIYLPNPIFRGNEIDLRATWTSNELLTQENGTWVFSGSGPWRTGMSIKHSFTCYSPGTWIGSRSTRSTITLPSDAQFESATAGLRGRWKDDSRWILWFEDTHKVEENQGLQITYTMPQSDASQGTD